MILLRLEVRNVKFLNRLVSYSFENVNKLRNFFFKMRMLTHQSLAKFGLMHMMATNICEWYRTVVVETLETLSEEAEGQTKATINLTDHVHG